MSGREIRIFTNEDLQTRWAQTIRKPFSNDRVLAVGNRHVGAPAPVQSTREPTAAPPARFLEMAFHRSGNHQDQERRHGQQKQDFRHFIDRTEHVSRDPAENTRAQKHHHSCRDDTET